MRKAPGRKDFLMSYRRAYDARAGSVLFIVGCMGLVLFLSLVYVAQRGGQVTRERTRLEDVRTARILADSAIAEGLVEAKSLIEGFARARCTFHEKETKPDGSVVKAYWTGQDQALKEMQGMQWKIPLDVAPTILPQSGIFSYEPVRLHIPDDWPVQAPEVYLGDLELVAAVTVKRRGVDGFKVKVRDRRSFRLSKESVSMDPTRRSTQYHVKVER